MKRVDLLSSITNSSSPLSSPVLLASSPLYQRTVSSSSFSSSSSSSSPPCSPSSLTPLRPSNTTPGTSSNLAPYSYTQVINHDPPLFIVSQAGGAANAKDSFKNLLETGECVINIVSEHFIEAANATSINAPYGISEWALTGLTPAPCSQIKPSRVKEAIFAIECKLLKTEEFESKATPGKKTSVLAILEGVRFWAREDAINEDKNLVDPAVCFALLPFPPL